MSERAFPGMRGILLCIILRIYAAEGFHRRNIRNLNRKYVPEWMDLDTRPLPQWYDSAKIGIFVHWGVYSVPGFEDEWFWHRLKKNEESVLKFMKDNDYDGLRYPGFARMFKAQRFDADEWAELFVKAGAKYVVLTAKHHDGYALFPSGRLNWNSVDIGPKIDIVDLLSRSIRKHGLKFGVYYSLFEWFNKLYWIDRKNDYNTSEYVDKIVWKDMKFLVNNYKPSVIWVDGPDKGPAEYWKSQKLLTWLYNESPVKDEVVVNDRWSLNTYCKHGGYYNCEDRYNPKRLIKHKWENAFTIDKKSWGFRRQVGREDLMSFKEILEEVVSTVSCGGNALINVGPNKDGIITSMYKKRLLKLGAWLKINGEAIYNTSAWMHQNDNLSTQVWYTCTLRQRDMYMDPVRHYNNVDAVYVIFLNWPKNNTLLIKDLAPYLKNRNFQIDMLTPQGSTIVTYHLNVTKEVVEINLYDGEYTPEQRGWVLRITENP